MGGELAEFAAHPQRSDTDLTASRSTCRGAGPKTTPSTPESYDEARERELWEDSERMVSEALARR